MNYKANIIRTTAIFLIIAITCTFFQCAQDPADIASKVAEEWASNNVNNISNNIAGLIIDSNPLIEKAVSMAISQQINQKVSWEYSTPRKLAEDRYEVVATAYSEIEMPLLGIHRVSVNYNLEIDTKQKQVVSADIDASSFALRKQ